MDWGGGGRELPPPHPMQPWWDLRAHALPQASPLDYWGGGGANPVAYSYPSLQYIRNPSRLANGYPRVKII